MRRIWQVTSVACLLLFFSLSVREAHALSLAVHIPEKYTDVKAGERLYFELDVKYPENPNRIDLRLEYEVNQDGKIISQSKVLKAVETQSSFLDYLVVPESAEEGLHTLTVRVRDYTELSEEVSATFMVRSKEDILRTYFFILLATIVAFSTALFWQIRRIRS